MASEIQGQFEKANNEFNSIQQEMSGYVSKRQQLEAQLQENKIVKEEFEHLKDDSKIYKLIGPVLVPQDRPEANSNVEKRLEFIQGEVKRVDDLINTSQKKLEEKRNELIQLRTSLQGDQPQ